MQDEPVRRATPYPRKTVGSVLVAWYHTNRCNAATGDWLRGRAHPSHGWGHKFKSCIAHQTSQGFFGGPFLLAAMVMITIPAAFSFRIVGIVRLVGLRGNLHDEFDNQGGKRILVVGIVMQVGPWGNLHDEPDIQGGGRGLVVGIVRLVWLRGNLQDENDI